MDSAAKPFRQTADEDTFRDPVAARLAPSMSKSKHKQVGYPPKVHSHYQTVFVAGTSSSCEQFSAV
jgi:hypothetical protein